MTVESGSFGNRFHIDLSANFSRSVVRQSSFNVQPALNERASNSENFYTRSSSVNLLEKALSDGLGKKIDLESNGRNPSFSRSIAENVLSFVRDELREARNSGASEQELQAILIQAREGIEQGFASAKEVLQGRFNNEPRLERQIERAFNKIQLGLEYFDNRYATNAIQQQQVPSQTTQQERTGDNSLNALQENSKPLQLQTESQARQIEYSKTRDVQRSRSFELSIETQEGDTVNINIQRSFSKQVSKQATFNEDGFTVSVDRQVQREKEISYQVTGDINEQEQAAIDKLIKNIDRLADKFYRGNFAGAFQKASRIGIDADQLANFSLNLQSSKTVEVTKTYREVQGVSSVQQTPSPVESIGEFISDVDQAASESTIANVVSDPVPVATELFKQIAIRDERYAQLVFEQSVGVIDDLANLAEQQLAETA